MSENGTDNAIVFNKMLKQIEKEQSTEKIKREVSIEFKRSDWLASMLAINSGGGAITGTTTGLTLPLIYDVDDQGSITNASVILNLGSEVHPHVFKFTATRDINIAFLNKPDGNNKAIFFVVEAHQDGDGGHAITATESATSFDINQQANSITILAGMCINDIIYLTNYGSRITETITTGGGTDDIEDWSRHKAKTTVDFGGNLLRKLSTITFSAGPEIHPKASGLEFRIGSGDTHQFKVNGNIELEIGTSIDAKSNKITNLARPTNTTDATNKTYVDTGLATKSNTDHTHTFGIEDLSDFSTASQVNTLLGTTGNNARLNIRGHDLTNTARLTFNNALGAQITTNHGTRYALNYQDPVTGAKRYAFQGVMNIQLGTERSSIDISRHFSNRDLTTEIESVVEIKGHRTPFLKLVNDHYYGRARPSDRASGINIGSIYFDAKTANTGSDPITYDQVTFVELKAKAKESRLTYPAWSSSNTPYGRGARVTRNNRAGEYYLQISPTPTSITPGTNNNIWRLVPGGRTLNRGSLDIVLRNTRLSNIGGADDTFHPIMTIDYDTGVTIRDHLFLPERDSDNQYNVCNIHSILNMGLGSNDSSVNSFKIINMYKGANARSNKIINLATPTSNNDAANKKYVDDKVGTGSTTGGGDVDWDMLEETLLPKTALGIDIGSLDKILNSVYSVYGRFRQLESGYKSTSTHNNIIYIDDHLYPTSTNNDVLNLGRSFSANRWNHIYGKNINPEIVNFKQISGTGATVLGSGTSMMYAKGNNLYFYAHGQREKQIQFVGGTTPGTTTPTPGTTNTAVLRIWASRKSTGNFSSQMEVPSTTELDTQFGTDLGQLGIWVDQPRLVRGMGKQWVVLCMRGKWHWFLERFDGTSSGSSGGGSISDTDPSSIPTKKRGSYTHGDGNTLTSTTNLPQVAGRLVVYQEEDSRVPDRDDGEIIITEDTSRRFRRFTRPEVTTGEVQQSATSSDLLTLPSSHVIDVSARDFESATTLENISNINGSIIYNKNSNRLCVKVEATWYWTQMSS